MEIELLRQHLRALGARPSHEARLLRAWLQGHALDAGPRTESNRLPKTLQAALPELEAALGRRKSRPSTVLNGIMFITAYLPASRRTMPSISSALSFTPSISVHWYWIG